VILTQDIARLTLLHIETALWLCFTESRTRCHRLGRDADEFDFDGVISCNPVLSFLLLFFLVALRGIARHHHGVPRFARGSLVCQRERLDLQRQV
jgi:hypothetical protein